MRYLSVCSGIEAATEAWHPLGWTPVAFAEIEKFPNAVLAHRHPDVPNLGNVEEIDASAAPLKPRNGKPAIDMLVGGFPCQDLSLAGKRKGLKNNDGTTTRSGLFYRIAALADAIGQRWTLLENVPGLLSSKGGRDFAAVVGELAGTKINVPDGGWRNAGVSQGPKGLVEWAILDAQYFGVPQRRRRVFIVRDSGNWADRPPLFLNAESLRGDSPPCRQERQGTTYDVAPCIGASGRGFERSGDTRGQDCLIPEIANPLTERMAKGINTTLSEGQTPIVTHTLRGEGHDASEDGTGRGTPIIAHTTGAGFWRDGFGTLRSREQDSHENLVAFSSKDHGADAGPSFAVRRLTPRECERLQGFPDDHTRIPWGGKQPERCPGWAALQGARKRWIGARIQTIEAYQP